MARLRPLTRADQDVLVRPPWLDDPGGRRCPPVVDVLQQLEELAMLLRRGLLSRAEFDRQKGKVLAD